MDPSHDRFQFSTAKKRPLSASLLGRKPQSVRTFQFGEADGTPPEQEDRSREPLAAAAPRPVLHKGPTSLRSSFFSELPPPQHSRHGDPNSSAASGASLGTNQQLRRHEPLIKWHRNATSLTDAPFLSPLRATDILRSAATSPPGACSSGQVTMSVDRLLWAVEESGGGANLRSHIFRAAAMAIKSAASPERSKSPARDVAAIAAAGRPSSALDGLGGNGDDDEMLNKRYFASKETGIPLVGVGLRVLLAAFDAQQRPSSSYSAPAFLAKPIEEPVTGLGMLNAVLAADIGSHLELQRRKRDEQLGRTRPSSAIDMTQQQRLLHGRLASKWSVIHGAVNALDTEDAIVGSAVKMGKARRPVSASLVRPSAKADEAAQRLARPTSASSHRRSPAPSGPAPLAAQRQTQRPQSAPLRRAQSSCSSTPAAGDALSAKGSHLAQAPWLDDCGLIGVSLDPAAHSSSPCRSEPLAVSDGLPNGTPSPARKHQQGVVRGGAGFVMFSRHLVKVN
jgi:hypothetical protein